MPTIDLLLTAIIESLKLAQMVIAGQTPAQQQIIWQQWVDFTEPIHQHFVKKTKDTHA